MWKDMDDEQFIVMLLVEYVSSKMLKKKRKKRSVWVKPYLLERERKSTFQLINDFRIQDTEEFRCFLRMDTETFTVTALHLYNCFRPFLSSLLLLLPPSSTTIYLKGRNFCGKKLLRKKFLRNLFLRFCPFSQN